MKAGLIWVGGLAQTYTLAGVNYGPSTKPLQIPAGLADTLGLEEIDEPESTDTGTGITLLGEAQAALRTVLDAQQQIAALFPQFKPGDILTSEDGPHPLVEAVKALKADSISPVDYDRVIVYGQGQAVKVAELTTELNTLKAQVARECEGWAAERAAMQQPAVAPQSDEATPEAQVEEQTPPSQPDVVASPASDDNGQAQAELSSETGETAQADPDEAAAPGDVDQRNKSALKAALDAAKIVYDPKANHATLLALASEHKV